MKALTRLGLRLATLSRKRDHCKTSSPSRLATLAPLDEEVLGGLILRCEGEARASKDEVAYYAMIPETGEGN